MNNAGGTVDIHKLIGRLPIPKGGLTLPNHKYTGPYNPLEIQLDQNDQPLKGYEPFNQVDEISMRHDICYRDNNTKDGKHVCDRLMLDDLYQMKPKNFREKVDRLFVKGIIGAKYKLGVGLNNKSRNALHTIYYNPESGFSSISELSRRSKVGRKDVRNWLLEQPTYTKHTPIKYKFPTRRVLVNGIDDQFQADLVDMRLLSRDNQIGRASCRERV